MIYGLTDDKSMVVNKCTGKETSKKHFESLLVDGSVYADATFVATCLVNGHPTVPEIVMNAVVD
ncbi:hypothetical protein LH67_18300 [Xenorhabdus nematophila]|nr:hypothetical protein LH67_18300 [Xenorhabdus nematophila]